MKTAHCLKCNVTLKVHCGKHGHKAPKACPFCGYDKSVEDVRKMAQIKLEKKNG